MTMPGFTAEGSLTRLRQRREGELHAAHDEHRPPNQEAVRRRVAEPASIMPAAYWGHYADRGCVRGERQYSAILWGIPWGYSWARVCRNTPGRPPGVVTARPPDACVNTGFNMWGEWFVGSRPGELPSCPTSTVFRTVWW
jgi:hypothetical protein